MNGIGPLSPVGLSAPLATGAPDARGAAASAVSELGHRVLSWVGAVGGSSSAGLAAWGQVTGRGSEFQPNRAELSRGGDVYDLRGLADRISGELGGTPTQEGELRRSLEGFAREAVVQVAGLSGASGDRQVAGLQQALADALAAPAGEGVDGVTARLDAATARLSAENGS